MATKKSSLEDRLASIEKVRSDLKKAEESASKDIVNMLKDLMKDNPQIEAIRWEQYTPSFNDGEPCEFSISSAHVKFSSDISGSGDDEEENSGFMDLDYDVDDSFFKEKTDILNHASIKKLEKAVNETRKIVNHLFKMEDCLQSMFGDGVQITVTQKGIETEDYDCGY